jgi:hypothetical protein
MVVGEIAQDIVHRKQEVVKTQGDKASAEVGLRRVGINCRARIELEVAE